MIAPATSLAMMALAATPPKANAASRTNHPSPSFASITLIPAFTMAMSSSRRGDCLNSLTYSLGREKGIMTLKRTSSVLRSTCLTGRDHEQYHEQNQGNTEVQVMQLLYFRNSQALVNHDMDRDMEQKQPIGNITLRFRQQGATMTHRYPRKNSEAATFRSPPFWLSATKVAPEAIHMGFRSEMGDPVTMFPPSPDTFRI